MSFIIENENQNIILLFDADIVPEEKAFATPKFPKPTFSGIYTHFDCFLPSNYKFDAAYRLAYRCFRICSSWTELPTELV